MRDSLDDNSVDVGISLDAIEDEIFKGLRSHADRLARAHEAEEFLAGRNAQFLKRRMSEEWQDYVNRPKRTSKITRKVCRILSEHLYNPGPTRKFSTGNAAVDAWLGKVYEANHVTALMQSADRKAILNATAAVQVVCTGRADKPVSLYLWGAHEFVPFFPPDDPTTPFAIVTIHRERRLASAGGGAEERLRFEAWSRDEHRQYASEWQPARDYRSLFGNSARYLVDMSGFPAGTGKNPYGCLPFSFVHDELPVCSFWEGGIGEALVEGNKEIDREMSDLAQVVKAHMEPDAFLRNVSPKWRREKRPGGWQHLTPGANKEGEATDHEPDAFYVQPTLAVEQVWLNIRNYADSLLEELDVPLTAVRDNLAVDSSGIALAVKLVPLISRTRGRQAPFTRYELDLLKLILTASGNYYQSAAYDLTDDDTRAAVAVSAGALLAVAEEPEAEILWPEPAMPYPTAERDQQDTWEMETGQKSLVDVVAERKGLTRDQAVERIKQVQADNELLEKILPKPEPVEPAPDPGKEPVGKDKPQQDTEDDSQP